MSTVKITYEMLFDILRREKNRNELQELDPKFYEDVKIYIREKNETANEQVNNQMSTTAEQEKIKIQLKNIKKILAELYEIRQKKIIGISTHKVRTNSTLIDTSKMLQQEKELYENLTILLNRTKNNILNEIQQFQTDQGAQIKERPSLDSKKPEQDKQDNASQNEEIQTKNTESITVEILTNLPKFMGLDKKIYGPYNKNDQIELPEELANMLIKKGRAKQT
ncbi:hypothetical protein K9L97_00600 [Candidatus Woesearchaeota archaeon]|nr:hypothetical protein [Candidatus Woesearchaeota archaeon]